MQLAASDGVVPVHHRLGVVVVHIDVTCRTILEKYFSWNFAIAFHFILHFLCILFVHLQIVNLERVGEGNLCGTECNIDVRYLDHCFWVLPILELKRVMANLNPTKKACIICLPWHSTWWCCQSRWGQIFSAGIDCFLFLSSSDNPASSTAHEFHESWHGLALWSM